MVIFPCSLVCLLVVDGDGKLDMLHMWGGIEGEYYTSLATVNRYVGIVKYFILARGGKKNLVPLS